MNLSDHMPLRLLSVLLVSFTACCSSAAQPITPERHAQVRDALARHDLARVEQTLMEFERGAARQFTRNNYDYLLARVLDRGGKATEAAAAYKKVIARNSPLAAYALFHLAELSRGAGDFRQEQDALNKLISQHPDYLRFESARKRLGASYFKSGQFEAAINALRPLGGVRGSLARESTARVGEAQLALGQSAAARATFESLMTGSSDDAALRAAEGLDRIDAAAQTKLTEAERLRRARIYQFNRSFAEARPHWLALVNEFPQSAARAEALFQLGRGLFLEDKFAEAIKWYERVHDEFPQKDEGEQGFYFVGHCYQYLNDADKAVARYEAFLKAYPNSDFVGTAHLNAIDTLRTAGRLDEALKWAARAQADVRDPFIKVTGLFHQARIRLSQEDYSAALADFTALRARNLNVRGPVATTNSSEVAFLRALSLEKLGRFEEAINEYLSFTEGRGGAAGYYGQRATARLRALAENNRARNIVAARLSGHLSQARAAHAEGNAAAAKSAANQALRLSTDGAVRREMLDVLRAAYARLPAYQLPNFTLIPAGRANVLDANAPAANDRSHAALANELLFLGLYDEGAPELAAAQVINGTTRDGAYSLAVYFARGDNAERALKFAEPLFNGVPDDYRPELMPRGLAELMYPNVYHDALQLHAAPRQVEPFFVLSIARQESKFDADVKSHAAARGLLQFISSTSSQIARQLRLGDFEQDDLYRPGVAILIGSQYMKNLFDEFGTPQNVAAAYNGSEQSVRRWVERSRSRDVDHHVIEIGKRETKDYVYKVLNNLWAYRALYRA
jgi:soluble lytic murein transglycosylase-like protein/TolA-binding protein